MPISIRSVLKRYVRPFVVPFVAPVLRLYFRRTPFHPIKLAVVRRLFPLLKYADYAFTTTTVDSVRVTGNTSDMIQRNIYYFGVWEPNLTAFLRRRLAPGDIFVDVGANVGYFSLLASKKVGARGKVLSIEASPMIYNLLQRNIHINHLDNITALNLAACDRVGRERIYLAPKSNLGETSILNREDFKLEAEVDASSLDHLIPAEDYARLRLLKIDVEGAEWKVLQGMKSTLARSTDQLEIAIEVRPLRTQGLGQSYEEVIDFMSSYGFRPYRLENDYSDSGYVKIRESPPRRIGGAPLGPGVVDLIFSRLDQESL